MPQLRPTPSQPNVKQLMLPSTGGLPEDQQAWVKFDVTYNTLEDFSAVQDGDPNFIIRNLRVVAHRIKEWNFTDKDGNVEPITFENVCHMEPVDLRYLGEVKLDLPPMPPLSMDDKKK